MIVNYRVDLDVNSLWILQTNSSNHILGLKEPYNEYDFIIIGAGSAGCALASRLTEDKNTTVLLIEAGKPEMILTDVPALAPYFQGTDYSWQYYMEPQPEVCKGLQVIFL